MSKMSDSQASTAINRYQALQRQRIAAAELCHHSSLACVTLHHWFLERFGGSHEKRLPALEVHHARAIVALPR